MSCYGAIRIRRISPSVFRSPAGPRPRAENLIGCFVNTLVLRTELSGELTFRDLLRRTRENCRGALAHQDLPFDKLVEELAWERDLSRHPLFQVMFAYQGDLAAELDLPGIKSVPVEIAAATAKFDLTLSLTERNRGLSGFMEYSSDLFDRSTITRMAGNFLTLLGGITSDPDRPIGALPLLAKAERKQILVDWNDTAVDYPKHRCMHELFEAQARKTPDATAVEFAGEHWTYGELHGRADRLARHLQSLGVGADSLVGVCVERSLEMIVGLLGILKAGGAYVPLDPKYPRERIAFMLADAQIEVLLVRDRASANRYQFSDRSMRIVCLDDDWQTMSVGRARKVPRAARSDNLAYVIYTSGSTGAPKGVAIEHRNAVALLCWAGSVFSHRELAGVLASTSICFDLSVFEIFVPLSWGGKIILVEDASGAARWRAGGRDYLDQYRAVGDERVARHGRLARRRCARSISPANHCEPSWCAGFINGVSTKSTISTVRPRRRPTRRSPGARSTAGRRSAGRLPIRKFTCSTRRFSRCRSACPASFTSAAPAWRAVTGADRN